MREYKADAATHETKALRFELESADDNGEFSGHAAVFGNRDSGDDIIEKGAFAKTIKDDFDRIKILALHNDCWLPIGKPLELREDEKGLFIRGKISDTQMGRDIRTLMRDGVLNELSIGYDAVEFDFDSKQGVRRLKEIKLWEVSIVTWAMNDQAKVDEVKSLQTLAEDIKAEAKTGKISKARLDALKPFIAVISELAEILGPFLEPPVQEEQPTTQANIKQAEPATETKKTGMVFEIIPNKSRR
ncbi:MAG: HK97 family phage prohead protease [Lachnospiraceae bacterium]|nr:HK97 family phage prohead protease [Clostridia bacterium]MBR1691170.1 HK97 family phage prohead protease [Lachnospiraceae bacterium]